jgi:hypothetical protein
MRGLAWSIILALGGISAHLSAGTLYSNLGPGNTFGGSTYGCGSGCGGFFSTTFTTTAGGQLASIQVPLFNPNGAVNVTVGLYTNSGGEPGTPLESWTIALTTSPQLITINSVATPTLSSGTQYWFVITLPGGNAVINWPQNSQNVLGGAWNGATLTGQTQSNNGSPTPAIQLLSPPPAGTPLPSTLLLTLCGLALTGLVGFGLRKRNVLT